MAWELDPPPEVEPEVKGMGELAFRSLMSEVKSWLDAGEWDDLAIARGITDKGHSEPFSYWLLKEVRIRESNEHRPAGSS